MCISGVLPTIGKYVVNHAANPNLHENFEVFMWFLLNVLVQVSCISTLVWYHHFVDGLFRLALDFEQIFPQLIEELPHF